MNNYTSNIECNINSSFQNNSNPIYSNANIYNHKPVLIHSNTDNIDNKYTTNYSNNRDYNRLSLEGNSTEYNIRKLIERESEPFIDSIKKELRVIIDDFRFDVNENIIKNIRNIYTNIQSYSNNEYKFNKIQDEVDNNKKLSLLFQQDSENKSYNHELLLKKHDRLIEDSKQLHIELNNRIKYIENSNKLGNNKYINFDDKELINKFNNFINNALNERGIKKDLNLIICESIDNKTNDLKNNNNNIIEDLTSLEEKCIRNFKYINDFIEETKNINKLNANNNNNINNFNELKNKINNVIKDIEEINQSIIKVKQSSNNIELNKQSIERLKNRIKIIEDSSEVKEIEELTTNNNYNYNAKNMQTDINKLNEDVRKIKIDYEIFQDKIKNLQNKNIKSINKNNCSIDDIEDLMIIGKEIPNKNQISNKDDINLHNQIDNRNTNNTIKEIEKINSILKTLESNYINTNNKINEITIELKKYKEELFNNEKLKENNNNNNNNVTNNDISYISKVEERINTQINIIKECIELLSKDNIKFNKKLNEIKKENRKSITSNNNSTNNKLITNDINNKDKNVVLEDENLTKLKDKINENNHKYENLLIALKSVEKKLVSIKKDDISNLYTSNTKLKKELATFKKDNDLKNSIVIAIGDQIVEINKNNNNLISKIEALETNNTLLIDKTNKEYSLSVNELKTKFNELKDKFEIKDNKSTAINEEDFEKNTNLQLKINNIDDCNKTLEFKLKNLNEKIDECQEKINNLYNKNVFYNKSGKIEDNDDYKNKYNNNKEESNFVQYYKNTNNSKLTKASAQENYNNSIEIEDDTSSRYINLVKEINNYKTEQDNINSNTSKKYEELNYKLVEIECSIKNFDKISSDSYNKIDKLQENFNQFNLETNKNIIELKDSLMRNTTNISNITAFTQESNLKIKGIEEGLVVLDNKYNDMSNKSKDQITNILQRLNDIVDYFKNSLNSQAEDVQLVNNKINELINNSISNIEQNNASKNYKNNIKQTNQYDAAVSNISSNNQLKNNFINSSGDKNMLIEEGIQEEEFNLNLLGSGCFSNLNKFYVTGYNNNNNKNNNTDINKIPFSLRVKNKHYEDMSLENNLYINNILLKSNKNDLNIDIVKSNTKAILGVTSRSNTNNEDNTNHYNSSYKKKVCSDKFMKNQLYKMTNPINFINIKHELLEYIPKPFNYEKNYDNVLDVEIEINEEDNLSVVSIDDDKIIIDDIHSNNIRYTNQITNNNSKMLESYNNDLKKIDNSNIEDSKFKNRLTAQCNKDFKNNKNEENNNPFASSMRAKIEEIKKKQQDSNRHINANNNNRANIDNNVKNKSFSYEDEDHLQSIEEINDTYSKDYNLNSNKIMIKSNKIEERNTDTLLFTAEMQNTNSINSKNNDNIVNDDIDLIVSDLEDNQL